MSLQIRFQCWQCKTLSDIDDLVETCEDCTQENEIKTLRNAIIDVASQDYHWKDRDISGFKNEREKDIYLKGVNKGYKSALFWMADYYGEVEFWEKLTEEKKC